jgi:enterochelin esterase-like enzyme
MLLGLVVAILLQGHVLFPEFIKTLDRTPERDRASLAADYLQGRVTPLVECDSLLHFVWFGHADSVLVNGSLQGGWRSPEHMLKIPCGDTARSPGLFYRSYVVPPDSRIEYKFIVNGEYQLDSTNRRTTPPGDFVNSEAVMPRFRVSPIVAFRDAVPHGTIDSLQFTSTDPAILPRRVWIYLPPGYARLKNLPAVYVHDGESAMRYAFIATIVDNLIADGELPPIVCVFVPPVEREAEYLGLKTPQYIGAFCDELIPLIDRTYRTSSDAARRGVMGISNGGHIALTMAVVRPDRFQLVAGQSSTIAPILRTALAVRQQSAPLPRTMKIWIDCGSFDIVDGSYNFPVLNRAFSAELTRYGIPHRFREVHDGHDWASWRERTPDILRFFFSLLPDSGYRTIQQR